VSGGAINSITIKLYDKDQCPPPDSQGRIDLNSCTILFNQDYSIGEEIDKYIPHGGTFYLYLQDSSSFCKILTILTILYNHFKTSRFQTLHTI